MYLWLLFFKPMEIERMEMGERLFRVYHLTVDFGDRAV